MIYLKQQFVSISHNQQHYCNMIWKEHFVELYINKHKADLESQKSLNLRFNNVLFDPAKISSTQADYSFEFELPATPNNDKIFDYANNLSKVGKFRSRFDAEVYADGEPIFTGTLTLNSFKDRKYQCNLVSVKTYSLDDIFGDSVLTDIDNWKINFNGVETINEKNAESNPDVVFPLVSYGAFQKEPYESDEAGNSYTSKYDLDQYNRWYVESFYPSLSLIDTIKHAFAYKGYTVNGNIFTDQFLNQIYMSGNLADNQSPDYNVGNPRFGSVDIDVSFTTQGQGIGFQQELQFPYYYVRAFSPESDTEEYNYKSVNIHQMLYEGQVTCNQSPSYMYQPNEGLIIIPVDGWYKIEMSATTTLNTTGTFTAAQNVVDMIAREMSFSNIELTAGLNEITPVEIQLIRNYDDNIELIKGKRNKQYKNGNPNDEYYWISEEHIPETRRDNIVDWLTCFPHEDPANAKLPTKQNELTVKTSSQPMLGGKRTSSPDSTGTSSDVGSGNNDVSASGNFHGYRGGTRGTVDRQGGERYYSYLTYGYVYKDGWPMCFDQAVTKSFICGFSSMYGGVASIMKNGYSWSKSTAEKNESFYPQVGYDLIERQAGSGEIIPTPTKHNFNTYINTPIASECTVTGNQMQGTLSCMVWLNKNDVLQLMSIHRAYTDEVGNDINYNSTTNVKLKITAFSPRSYNDLLTSHCNRYEAPIEFDTQLNLANFLNKEKKISEWVQNVIDAFNLELTQYGNSVSLDVKKKFNRSLLAAVDLDNRVNSNEAEASLIEYPRSMSVKYKIDTDEHGFYDSVPQDKIDLPNWKDYGDSGYSVVELSDDTYTTTTSDKNLQFSYTWYDDFKWYNVDSAGTKVSDTYIKLSIPVISKEEYMIDGYDYSESLKHDGYGLAQRFWFRPNQTSCFVWTQTYPKEKVILYTPTNLYTNYRDVYLYLSYKLSEQSLLQQYFNITPYLASNYVTVEAYITPDEYNMIKSGAMLKFDEDLYFPVEISGYDPSGYNKTEIKMMKKL